MWHTLTTVTIDRASTQSCDFFKIQPAHVRPDFPKIWIMDMCLLIQSSSFTSLAKTHSEPRPAFLAYRLRGRLLRHRKLIAQTKCDTLCLGANADMSLNRAIIQALDTNIG